MCVAAANPPTSGPRPIRATLHPMAEAPRRLLPTFTGEAEMVSPAGQSEGSAACRLAGASGAASLPARMAGGVRATRKSSVQTLGTRLFRGQAPESNPMTRDQLLACTKKRLTELARAAGVAGWHG